MSTTVERAAGVPLAEQTNPLGPPLPRLTPKAEVALLARMLFREGYDDHLAGHIAYRQDDGTFLTNPFGLAWDEIRAGDVMRMDLDGNVLEGPWTVSPAIELHLALHRRRHDVVVSVHNHPRWGTIWADMRRVPAVYDQTAAMVADPIALYGTYGGTVNDAEEARRIADAIGDARCALLANHGVLVAANDVAHAYHRSMVLEWRCRQAWHVEAAGGGVALEGPEIDQFARIFDYVPFPHLFEAMARRELRADPSVLDED